MSAGKLEEFYIHRGDTMVPQVKRKSEVDKIRMTFLLHNNRCVR